MAGSVQEVKYGLQSQIQCTDLRPHPQNGHGFKGFIHDASY